MCTYTNTNTRTHTRRIRDMYAGIAEEIDQCHACPRESFRPDVIRRRCMQVSGERREEEWGEARGNERPDSTRTSRRLDDQSNQLHIRRVWVCVARSLPPWLPDSCRPWLCQMVAKYLQVAEEALGQDACSKSMRRTRDVTLRRRTFSLALSAVCRTPCTEKTQSRWR